MESHGDQSSVQYQKRELYKHQKNKFSHIIFSFKNKIHYNNKTTILNTMRTSEKYDCKYHIVVNKNLRYDKFIARLITSSNLLIFPAQQQYYLCSK